LIVPNATLVDVDIDGEGVVAVWLLEQADTKTKPTTSTTGGTAMNRPGKDSRM